MDGVAGKLDGPVQTAVRPHVADDAQGEVLGGDSLRHRAVEVDAHGRRNLQPQLALGPQGGDLAPSNAGAKGPQPPKVGGMGIGTQNDLPGFDHHLLRQDLVADAAASLEKMVDPLLADKLADFPVVLGVHRGRCRHGMVEGDGHAIRMLDSILAEFFPDPSNGRRVVVTEYDIGFDIQDFANRAGIPACGLGQGFLCECLSGHGAAILRELLDREIGDWLDERQSGNDRV